MNIDCFSADGPRVSVAFIVGFGWRQDAQNVEVQVLRDGDPVWTILALDVEAAKLQIEAIVFEIVGGASLMLKRGRFAVMANG